MGRAPAIWVATDQTATAVFYFHLFRSLMPVSLGVRMVTFRLITEVASVGPAIGGLSGRLRDNGFDGSRDVLVVVHDEENHDRAQRNLAKAEITGQLMDELVGLTAARLHMFLVPPTTEAIYFMLSEIGCRQVRACLHRFSRGTEHDHRQIGRQRLAVARAPRGGAPGPKKAELGKLLQLRSARKRALAEQMGEAISADLRADDHRDLIERSRARCLIHLLKIADRLA